MRRFNIGDYVEVKAVTIGTHDSPDKTPRRVLRRKELPAPARGWIVGAARRFAGPVKGGYGDGEMPYLQRDDSAFLWKVAQSLTNKPLEVAEEDMILVLACLTGPRAPLRLSTKWLGPGWSPEEQRAHMKDWPRDEHGKWKPKQKPGAAL